MHFNPKSTGMFLYKFADTARFAEEKKTRTNVSFVLLLEKKMTADDNSRVGLYI